MDVFATGVKDVTAPVGGGAGEILRLNTAFDPTPLAAQFPLGAAGCFLGAQDEANPYGFDASSDFCDPNGFPNGRRPIDDIVDIELAVLATDFLRADGATGVVLHDGVAQEKEFRSDVGVPKAGTEVFPYLPTPVGGTRTGAR